MDTLDRAARSLLMTGLIAVSLLGIIAAATFTRAEEMSTDYPVLGYPSGGVVEGSDGSLSGDRGTSDDGYGDATEGDQSNGGNDGDGQMNRETGDPCPPEGCFSEGAGPYGESPSHGDYPWGEGDGTFTEEDRRRMEMIPGSFDLGDVPYGGTMTEEDLRRLQEMRGDMSGDEFRYAASRSDINRDGVIDQRDRERIERMRKIMEMLQQGALQAPQGFCIVTDPETGELVPTQDRAVCEQFSTLGSQGMPVGMEQEFSPEREQAFREEMEAKFAQEHRALSMEMSRGMLQRALAMLQKFEGEHQGNPPALSKVREIQTWLVSELATGMESQEPEPLLGEMQGKFLELKVVLDRQMRERGEEQGGEGKQEALARFGTMIGKGIPAVIEIFADRGLLDAEQVSRAEEDLSSAREAWADALRECGEEVVRCMKPVFVFLGTMRGWMEPLVRGAMESDPVLKQAIEEHVGGPEVHPDPFENEEGEWEGGIPGGHGAPPFENGAFQYKNWPNGVNGINSPNGTNGVNAVNGLNGVNGINGVNGVNGINAVNGVNGINGVNGVR